MIIQDTNIMRGGRGLLLILSIPHHSSTIILVHVTHVTRVTHVAHVTCHTCHTSQASDHDDNSRHKYEGWAWPLANTLNPSS